MRAQYLLRFFPIRVLTPVSNKSCVKFDIMASIDDALAAQAMLTLGGPGGVDGGSSNGDPLRDFQSLCIRAGVSQQTLQTLLSNGINTTLILTLMRPGDLEALSLSVGQLRLLQGVQSTLCSLSAEQSATPQMATPQVAQAAGPPAPPASPAMTGTYAAPSGQSPIGVAGAPMTVSRETLRRLGLGGEGERASYSKVKDFVTLVNRKSGDDECVYELPDGGKFVPKEGTLPRRIRTDQVSPLQYMEASMRILVKMILSGTIGSPSQVSDYAGYVAVVARLGQKKTWKSTLMYDDAYREAQALEGFPWGKDLRDLRDEHLEQRPAEPAKASTGHSTTNHAQKTERGKNPASSRGDSDAKMKLCYAFNKADGCSKAECEFAHFCAVCGSSAHGGATHPSN